MDTVSRLAVRLSAGRTIEDAALREYLYRWRLACISATFGAPHMLGL